jgi:hypothetical protein
MQLQIEIKFTNNLAYEIYYDIFFYNEMKKCYSN